MLTVKDGVENGRFIKIVYQYGYELKLVEVLNRKYHADPCFLGISGYALHSCKKLSRYKCNQLKNNV